ncbi:Kinesin-like protein KIN-7N [Hypsizygus marmoreus]|uniref:Kinesin-like protein n=1 Tax=Hypsizygus marmoreus TaxID=39966 RepID=A0A369JD90_HYPMA|nr:Kinesin-like protein KIN-7N [Hypsizygus marmoreus]
MVVSTASTPAKPTRPAPFTPKRPLSAMSTTSTTMTHTTLLASTHKKYKATLSTESRARVTTTKAPMLAPVPGTPTRPRTPGTPRSPSLMPMTSEMDVSNVDPEEVLVDYQTPTVEPGDISGEVDEAWLRGGYGKEDKVMVSIRPPRPISMAPHPGHQHAQAQPPPRQIHLLRLHLLHLRLHPHRHPQQAHLQHRRALPRARRHGRVQRRHLRIYGQTASGKTFTLTGDDTEPGIIPRAMRDVFAVIRRTPGREYLLRCSYLEIYNEAIHDLLAPPTSAVKNPVQIQGGGSGGEIVLAPLREEVVTSLKGVKEVLRRGEGNRRTAWYRLNERSSRSHSVFRMVIESRERGEEDAASGRHTPGLGRQTPANGRQTPGPGGRATPGPGGRAQTPGLGGPRLKSRGGKSVQTSVLSLIDLAGSEKATSDKERTREGKCCDDAAMEISRQCRDDKITAYVSLESL